MKTKPCKGCLYESRTGERLSHGYHVCDGEMVIPARYAKDMPGCQDAVDYPVQPMKANQYLQVQNQLDLFSCEEIQKYLKEKYGLGCYPLSMPFQSLPHEA